MRLRAQWRRPSVGLLLVEALSLIVSEDRYATLPDQAPTTLVRAMTRKMYGAFAASLGLLALALEPNAAAAGSGAGPRAAFAAPHPHSAGSFRHFRRQNGVFSYWPGYDDDNYGPPFGGSPGGTVPPASNDVRFTEIYDVPWDWAHRLPPMVAPSDHPYVPGCHDEAVTVPGRGGAERIVNVTRCY
jgi:hypothetical protein